MLKQMAFKYFKTKFNILKTPANRRRMTATAETRVERDSFGDILVPASKYYGANTARSLIHFNIGGASEQMPVTNQNELSSFKTHQIFIFLLKQIRLKSLRLLDC